jgi:hypothetical protein
LLSITSEERRSDPNGSAYIANLARARGIRGTTLVMTDAHLLPIGRSYRDDVRKRLGLL